MQVIAIAMYHHEEHEGHKVKLAFKILRGLRGLRVLHGKQFYTTSLELTF